MIRPDYRQGVPSTEAATERAVSLLRSGMSPGAVEADLIATGIAPDTASLILDGLPVFHSFARRRSLAKREILSGLGFISIGVGLTLLEYFVTHWSGGSFVICVFIVYGLFRLIRGFAQQFEAPPRS